MKKLRTKTEWVICKKIGRFPGDHWDYFTNEKNARRSFRKYDSKNFRLVKMVFEETEEK